MKKIGLIAFDLDGTMLDSHKRLSKRNMEAITRCIDQGIWIVPTTGRPTDGIAPQILGLCGVDYAITTNGAVVADLKNRRILKYCTIPNETALNILRRLEHYHVMFDPYINGRGISQPEFMDHLDEYGVRAEIKDLVRATRDVVPNIISYVKQYGKGIEKINVFTPDLRDKETIRGELAQIPGLVVSSSMPGNIEINAEGATKGEALLWLADYLGVARDATMAFGDGENDISMLKAAGRGIAMANGVEAAFAAADEKTLTNDEDGVAVAIERIVFGQ